jgi:hypothetical protein
LINTDSLFWEYYQEIKTLEREKYNTDDPFYLGLLQWSNVSLLQDPIYNVPLPLPPGQYSALYFNLTLFGRFSLFPEVKAFEPLVGLPITVDYTNIAESFSEY